MHYSSFALMNSWGVPFASFGFFFFLLIVWSIVWKGLALWAAAHDESKPWFIALLIINTAGILEILYLYIFRKGLRKGEKEVK